MPAVELQTKPGIFQWFSFKAGDGSQATPYTDDDVTLAAGENFVGAVGGNTVALSDTFTRPADTTAYAVDDVVSNSTTATTVLTFAQAARKNGGTGYVTNARLVTNNPSTTNASFRLYLYNQTPTAPPGDNSPFLLTWANRGIRLGVIDFVLSTGATGSDAASTTVTNINLRLNTQPSSRSVFGLLVARAAYVPTSGQQFFVELTFEQN